MREEDHPAEQPNPMDDAQLRRSMYVILIALAAGSVAGRILSLPTQLHADNDGSRWATVRALVDDGTYAIGRRESDPGTGIYHDYGIVAETGWKTFDCVLRPGEGTRYFYSSKLPLLPTLVAGEYWLLKRTLGWSIVNQGTAVNRTILLTINWLPLVIYLLVMARLVEMLGTTTWGRLFVMAGAALGIYLNLFSVTFNDHTIAACSALFALDPALRIWCGGRRSAGCFALTGFFAAFAACNQLPAALYLCILALAFLIRFPRQTLLFFVPAALIPVAGLLFTNYLAIGQLLPAYGEFGGSWYNFEGSHWIERGTAGIDYAQDAKAVYAFHLLFGHHGLFLLTPIFLLSIVGCWVSIPRSTRYPGPARALARLTCLLVPIVVVFFVMKTNNYGGWSNGPRWLIWLTPFLVLTMIPAADWLATRRWGRALACVLLALSALSVSYRPQNPWRHPWIYDFLEWNEWIHY
jgi:hypothetical protein